MPRTPASGWPIPSIAAIESLREDLRAHSANDERELSTIREDVKELIKVNAGQVQSLSQIQSSLSTRARTETELVKYDRKKRLLLQGTILTIVSALVGAAIHHFL